jgi:hypothetical protein
VNVLFGIGLGLITVAIGLITAVLAPRIGPNPIFGFRIGYAYATRQIWDETNRRGGLLFASVGAATAATGAVISWLGIQGNAGAIVVTTVLLAGLLGSTAWMLFFSRRLALATAPAKRYPRLAFRPIYLAPVAVTSAALLASLMLSYPTLPERLATHFDLFGEPDGWSDRQTFILSYLGVALFPLILNLAAIAVATREPLIVFGRWGTRWVLEPERGLIFTGIALSLVNLLLLPVMLNVVSFNTRGAFLFPFLSLLWLILPLLLLIVGLFFVLARQEPRA